MAKGTNNKRTGSMTAAMSISSESPSGNRRVLRVGMMRSGKILRTRVFDAGSDVRVGGDIACDFAVSLPRSLPEHSLFKFEKDGYVLRLGEGMRARIAEGSEVEEIQEVSSDGKEFELTQDSRGRITIGDTKFLFQFVDPPPIAVKAQLPASVQRGFTQSVDWAFITIAAVVYMSFFAWIIALDYADWPYVATGDQISDDLASLIKFDAPVPEPDVEEVVDEELPEEGEDEVEVSNEKASGKTKETSESTAGSGESSSPNNNADARARIASDIAASIRASLMTASGAGGSFADALSGEQSFDSLADAMANSGGINTASGSDSGFRQRGGGGTGGSGETGSLGSLSSKGGGQKASEGSKVTERKVRGNLNIGSGGDIGGTGAFDAKKVVREINRRKGAIKACYERALRSDPGLAGRIKVEFTIQERGNVTGAKATSNSSGSSELATCVTRVVRRLRFNPGPDGGSVKFSYPFVFSPQN